jgi:hypothetical protein
VRRSRCDLLRSGHDLVLRSQVLLRPEVLQDPLPPSPEPLLQIALLQVELLCSGPDLLRSRADLRCSLRSDVRCSRGCLLQLV